MEEEKKTALKVEFNSVKVEFDCVKAELGKTHDRLLELWQENCQQLIEFDNVLAKKDQEILLLKEKLQIWEMEFTHWKLSNLTKPAIKSGVAKIPTRD